MRRTTAQGDAPRQKRDAPRHETRRTTARNETHHGASLHLPPDLQVINAEAVVSLIFRRIFLVPECQCVSTCCHVLPVTYSFCHIREKCSRNKPGFFESELFISDLITFDVHTIRVAEFYLYRSNPE